MILLPDDTLSLFPLCELSLADSRFSRRRDDDLLSSFSNTDDLIMTGCSIYLNVKKKMFV